MYEDKGEISDWMAEDYLVAYRAISLSKAKLFSIDSAQSKLREIEQKKGSNFLEETLTECYYKALAQRTIPDFVKNVFDEAKRKVANFNKHSINKSRKEGKGKF